MVTKNRQVLSGWLEIHLPNWMNILAEYLAKYAYNDAVFVGAAHGCD